MPAHVIASPDATDYRQHRLNRRIPLVIAGVLGCFVAWGLLELQLRSWEPIVNGVVEPVTMIDGGRFDDGGSEFISFMDAAGVVRGACLLNEIDGKQNLVYCGRDVALNGPDECSFLALLERWLRQDPDAQQYISPDHAASSIVEPREKEERGKWYAVIILQRLRDRNSGGLRNE